MPKKYSKEEVISQFKERHGEKYDYSKVNYKGNTQKVTIICPDHGPFEQTPSQHKVSGCAKCGGTMKLTQEEVISKFEKKHHGRYDYRNVTYTSSQKKIEIVCREHGSFFQTPNDHLSGKGCARCGRRYKRKTNEIIEEFKEVHGETYDYSKIEYITDKRPVTIICRDHGPFEQTPKTHKKGTGCPHCYGEIRSEYLRLDKDTVIQHFIERHGSKYDYSLVDYLDGRTPVTIICSDHGSFKQIPNDHKQGAGCPKCGIQDAAKKRSLDTNEIINSFISLHGERYNYDQVTYVNKVTKVKIYCKTHGYFWQTPHNHKNGQHCPMCQSLVQNVVYVWEALNHTFTGRLVKFGVTSDSKDLKRISIVAKKWGFDFDVLYIGEMPTREVTLEAEKILHQIYTNIPKFLEKHDGYSEFRLVTDSDLQEAINFLKSIQK